MRTPFAALAWEIWRKHRNRLIAIIGLVLGFAVLYPRLCALAGFDPHSRDALDEFGKLMNPVMDGGLTPLRILRLLFLMFLVGGPMIAMVLSLLCVTWMFTFIEFNPNKKNPINFPARVFTLPVSTSFLFWFLFLGGMAAISMLYASWVYLVPLPKLEEFGVYQKCFGWMTLLALAQAITWGLAAWPFTRLLLLNAVLICFLCARAWSPYFQSPLVLPAVFLFGTALARLAMQRVRHGRWQGLNWKWPLPTLIAPVEMRGPRRFSSAARAQLWFEWRRFARMLVLVVAALTLTPVLIHLVARFVFFHAPLQNDTLFSFAIFLIVVPPLAHFSYSLSPGTTDQSFLAIRPLTVGEMTMALAKAAFVSTALSWAAVLAAVGGLCLLGDFRTVERNMTYSQECTAAIVIGLIFFTWRFVVVNLWSARSGNSSLAGLPPLALLTGALLLFLHQSGILENFFSRIAPFISSLLACVVAAKLLLAFLAFRSSVKRHLIAPSAVIRYLAIWFILVAALLPVLLVLPQPPRDWLVPLSLCVVLIVPLARIAYAPIMLARARHT
jgi:hypothetical protein